MPRGVPDSYRRLPAREAAPPPCDAAAYELQLKASRPNLEPIYPIADLILVLVVAVVLLSSVALGQKRT